MSRDAAEPTAWIQGNHYRGFYESRRIQGARRPGGEGVQSTNRSYYVEGHLGASELAQIREFNYVGEYKLAVEALLLEIAHNRVSVGPTEQDILFNLGRRMKVDAELLAPFNIK